MTNREPTKHHHIDITKYLERISFDKPISNDIDCLNELHISHMMSIPFEALDVHLNNPIHLNINSIYHKVINRNRGGYCYELNFLFHTLLQTIGFQCSIISCSVYDEEKEGPEYDHLAIIVDMGELWLVDVGFGDLFLKPLKIQPGKIQEDKSKNYRIEQLNAQKYILTESLKEKSEFIKKYSFDIQPRAIEEFEDQNNFKQYSPESHFVKKRICTIPTPNGRKTITNNTYKQKINGQVIEREIIGDSDFYQILKEEFNIEL